MNRDGINQGKSISEIKVYSDRLYELDFPISVIRTILEKISKELNSEEHIVFNLFRDGSFSIRDYVFAEFEEVVLSHKAEVESLEKHFQDFCQSSQIVEYQNKSIFSFIEKSKHSLARYLSNKKHDNNVDFSVEAEFVSFFRKFPPIYNQIKNLYLGSILASYVEYKTDSVNIDVELLFDTNFILGLLDLNTPESMHTCCTLIKIASQQGYVLSVMSETLEEANNLLKAKAQNFDQSFLQKKIYPEDVYNACDRRGLSKADLERIADNLQDDIGGFGIRIIFETKKYRNIAKFGDIYKSLVKIRNSPASALHDATAFEYVRVKRGKNIYEFDKVNCWFVNNSISREGNSSYDSSGRQPESIKADDLLNILWLSNPQTNSNVDLNELSEIGLSSLISLGLTDSLPKTSIIRELDDNIQKYAEKDLSDLDIIRVATRITTKQLKDVQELNNIASKNSDEFVKRLQSEAQKQKEIEEARLKRLESAVSGFKERAQKLEEERQKFNEKSTYIESKIEKFETDNRVKEESISLLRQDLLREKNAARAVRRADYIRQQVSKWRKRSWIEFVIGVCVFLVTVLILFYIADWDFNGMMVLTRDLQSNVLISWVVSIVGFLFTSITITTIVGKYRNHSNIENFKKGLDIPEDFKDLEKLD
ncbi:MAG: cell envelope integrity protein TolA [Imperialibacter sp.]